MVDPAIPVRRLAAQDIPTWIALRAALWPTCPDADHRTETATMLAETKRCLAIGAADAGGTLVGFAEACLRIDPVNGCATSPVAFLEGIYVAEQARRQGVARALTAAVEHWARDTGCLEFADAAIDNASSFAMHAALGFAETERVVYFRKSLAPDAA